MTNVLVATLAAAALRRAGDRRNTCNNVAHTFTTFGLCALYLKTKIQKKIVAFFGGLKISFMPSGDVRYRLVMIAEMRLV